MNNNWEVFTTYFFPKLPSSGKTHIQNSKNYG